MSVFARCSLAVLVFVGAIHGGWAQAAVPVKKAARTITPSVVTEGQFGRGDTPIPYDIPAVSPPARAVRGATDPAWDWRAHGGVTPVKDQGQANTCWLFATIGEFESKVKLHEILPSNLLFSEQALGNCNANGNYSGGNVLMAINHLTRVGGILSSAEPYVAAPASCDGSDVPVRVVRQFRYLGDVKGASLSGDVMTLKNALAANGPVKCSMSVQRVKLWDSRFDSFQFPASLVVPLLSGATSTDHAVLIVGWDDNKAWSGLEGSGTGAWLVKNSWGSSWADSGYFWIAYGSAAIGSASGYIPQDGYEAYRSQETLLEHDSFGWQGASVGYDGDYDAYAITGFTPSFSSGARYLTRVSFWNVKPGVEYEVRVFQAFDSLLGPTGEMTAVGNRPSGTCPTAGYYTVDLPTSILLISGDDFWVQINYRDPSNTYTLLVPFESKGGSVNTPTVVPDVNYVSDTGAAYSWSPMNDTGDLGIRAIMSPTRSSVSEWSLY